MNRIIKKSKAKPWSEICKDLDNDVWGKAYQIVVKRLGRAAPEAQKSLFEMNSIIDELFPKYPT